MMSGKRKLDLVSCPSTRTVLPAGATFVPVGAPGVGASLVPVTLTDVTGGAYLPAKKLKTVNILPKLTGQTGNMGYFVVTQPINSPGLPVPVTNTSKSILGIPHVTTTSFGTNSVPGSRKLCEEKTSRATASRRTASAHPLFPETFVKAEPPHTAVNETPIKMHCLLCDEDTRHYSHRWFTKIYSNPPTHKSTILRNKLQEALRAKLPPCGKLSSNKVCQSCVYRLDKVVEGRQEERSISAAYKAKMLQYSVSMIPQISHTVNKHLIEDIQLQISFLGEILRTQAYTEKTAHVLLTELSKLVESLISTFFKGCSLGDIMLQSELDTTEMSLGFVLEALKGEQSQPTNIADQTEPQTRVLTETIPKPRVSTETKPRVSTEIEFKPIISTETKPQPRISTETNTQPAEDTYIPIQIKPEPESWDVLGQAAEDQNIQGDEQVEGDIHGGLCLSVEDCGPGGDKLDCGASTPTGISGNHTQASGLEDYGVILATNTSLDSPMPISKVKTLKNEEYLYQPPADLVKLELPLVKVVSTLPVSKILKLKEYRCFMCEYHTKEPVVYPDELLLYSHVWEKHLIHNEGDVQCMKCPECESQITLKLCILRNTSMAGQYLFRMVMRHLICSHSYRVPEYVESEKCQQPACTYSGLTQTDMKAHELLHSKGAYFCNVCCRGFRYQVTCYQHLLNQHNHSPKSQTIFTCPLCDYRCILPRLLHEHKKDKHPQLLANRGSKKAITESRSNAKRKSRVQKLIVKLPRKGKQRKLENVPKRCRHLLSHIDHICVICEVSKQETTRFSNQDDLYDHVSEEHIVGGQGSTDIACPKCGKTTPLKAPAAFPARRRLAYHNVFVHLIVRHKMPVPDYINAVKCDFPECSFGAISKQHLGIHKDRHRERALCKMCGKTFHSSSLKKHETGCPANPEGKEPNRKKQCTLCGKKTWHLEIHMKQHDKKSKKPCEVCSKLFAKPGMKIHMFLVHGLNPDNKETVKCPDCDFVTLMPASNLRHHRMRHVPGESQKCPLCHSAVSHGHLNDHMRSVHGPRSFQCSRCAFRSTTRVALSRHLAAQHLGVRFKCDWCPYTSGYQNNVIKHDHTCRKNPANRPRKQGSHKPSHSK